MSSATQVAGTVNSRGTISPVNLSKYTVIGIGVTFLTWLILLPLFSMFQYASSNGLRVFWESISSPEALFSLKLTLLLATATAAINGVMGTVVAFMLVRHEFPLKGLLDSLVDLPLAIPASVTGVTLLLLYGPLGMLGQMFHWVGIPIMFAFPGILIAHVFMTLPYVIRGVGPLLQGVEKSQEEAAKTLGATELQIFSNVILPSVKGGLISGCVFVFARSLGEFGATIMVSGNLALRTQTAPMLVFSEFNKGNVEGASAMSVFLVIISFVLFFGFKLGARIMQKRGETNAKRAIR